jgi:hypothetical protein
MTENAGRFIDGGRHIVDVLEGVVRNDTVEGFTRKWEVGGVREDVVRCG